MGGKALLESWGNFPEKNDWECRECIVLARSSESTARVLLTEVRVLLRGPGVRRPRDAESLAGGRGSLRRSQA